MESFIAASDLHGIEQDKSAVAAFRRHVDLLQPKNRYFLGDLWNFAALRRQADEVEKNIRLKEDFEAGINFLEWYRPQYLLLGNHDQRLWDAVTRERVNRTGWLAELAATYIERFEKVAKTLGIRVFPYDKAKGVAKVGGLNLSHGFGGGETLSQRMAATYGNVMHGHGHRIERTPVMNSGIPVVGYQIGCLCRMDMEYTRADLGYLKQEHGWGYGLIGKKTHTVIQARFANGHATVAENLIEI